MGSMDLRMVIDRLIADDSIVISADNIPDYGNDYNIYEYKGKNDGWVEIEKLDFDKEKLFDILDCCAYREPTKLAEDFEIEDEDKPDLGWGVVMDTYKLNELGKSLLKQAIQAVYGNIVQPIELQPIDHYLKQYVKWYEQSGACWDNIYKEGMWLNPDDIEPKLTQAMIDYVNMVNEMNRRDLERLGFILPIDFSVE